jgi:hypothetical protein
MGGYIPFVEPEYRPERSRIPDLIMARGQAQAQGHLDRGGILGGTVQGIGQLAGGTIQQVQQAREMAKRDAAFVRAVEGWNGKDPKTLLSGLMRVLGPQEGPRAAQAVLAFHSAAQPDPAQELKGLGTVLSFAEKQSDDVLSRWYPALIRRFGPTLEKIGVPAESLPPEWTPEARPQLSALKAAIVGEAKPEAGFTLGAGETRFGPDGKPIANVPPKPVEPKMHKVTVPGPNGPMAKLATEEELAAGVPEYRAPVQPREPPSRFWVMRDGKPIRVNESEYRPGDQPASTREQGRPVTSGDAGRVADLDTSLDDLKTLGSTLTGSKATGTAAKAGAMLPNAITEATGIGAEAKSKQAVIDRVKQVIGKALEGGVLRKEDEYKYEKILPTIGDVPSVVKSKLEGLEKAIKQRRQTLLESLSDAGYDTAKYDARKRAEPKADPLGLR